MRKYKYLFLFILCVIVDQWTKLLAYTNKVNFKICDILNFSLVKNRGVSWGIFSEASPYGFYLLTAFIITIAASIAVYTIYYRLYKNKQSIWLETLLLAGAISNIIDRFAYGAVIDFIQFHIGSWYWPTFNIADVLVVCAVLGIIIRE